MGKIIVNKNKVVRLIEKIDKKKIELRQLKKDLQKAFDEISNMWKKESALQFPQYPPCNLGEYVGEYVGVDIILKERVYNIYISEYKQRLYCMFCLDRKDKKNSTIPLKKTMDQADFDTLKSVVNDYLTRSGKEVWSTADGYYVLFEKEHYEDAFLFYLEIVKSFKSTCV
jgi:hypothetical protein